MRKKLLQVFGVLALGAHVKVPEEPSTWWVQFDGPAFAVAIYAIVACVVLFRVLNHLPGVLALRQPLGAVRSGYEHLWGPAILVALCGFSYRGYLGEVGAENLQFWTLRYGNHVDSTLPAFALGAFVLMMWLLKLHAAMIEANRRLGAAAG